jgi:Ca2+-binding EF-hand superfamily protein
VAKLLADKQHKSSFISREEAKAMPRLAKNFDEIDTNKDGKISQEELIAFRSKTKK